MSTSLTTAGLRTTGALTLEVIVLAALPLLSRATLLGGTAEATWPELLALPVWVAALFAGPVAWKRGGRGMWPAFALFAAAIIAGVLIVLLQDHRPGSPILAENLSAAATRWFGAWSVNDPLFPLRSATIYLSGPLFFIAVRSVWGGETRPRLFEPLIVGGGAVAALAALAQAVSGRGLVFDAMPGEPLVGRAPGLLPDPNAFASYLALTAAFGAVVWGAWVRHSDGRARTRCLAGAAAWAALMAAALWASGSRAALLALLLVFGVAMLLNWVARRDPGVSRKHTALAALGAAALVALVAGIATVGSLGSLPDQSRLHRFLSVFDVGQPSMRLLRGRPALWSAGVAMVVDEPVAGVGPGRYGVQLPGYVPADLWGVASAENAHNYYLQVAAETGVVGFAGFALMLAAAVGALWTQRRETRARAALYGAIAWGLTSLTGHPQLIPSLQLFFWGFLGVGTAGYVLPRFTPRLAALLVLAALLSARVGQETFAGERGPPLYATGLYEREAAAPGQEILRWTSGHTEIELRREGYVVEMRFFVAHEQLPLTVRTAAGGWSETHHYFDGGWKSVSYYIPRPAASSVLISLDASPPFEAAGDPRDLGVMLAPLRWLPDPPRESLGAYPVEQDAEGRRFRWTSGAACLPLATSSDVDIELRADNPDLETNPLVVTLIREGTPPQPLTIEARTWQTVRIPGGEGVADLLCVQTDRTWNPRLDVGSTDVRDLGVAIALGTAEHLER